MITFILFLIISLHFFINYTVIKENAKLFIKDIKGENGFLEIICSIMVIVWLLLLFVLSITLIQTVNF